MVLDPGSAPHRFALRRARHDSRWRFKEQAPSRPADVSAEPETLGGRGAPGRRSVCRKVGRPDAPRCGVFSPGPALSPVSVSCLAISQSRPPRSRRREGVRPHPLAPSPARGEGNGGSAVPDRASRDGGAGHPAGAGAAPCPPDGPLRTRSPSDRAREEWHGGGGLSRKKNLEKESCNRERSSQRAYRTAPPSASPAKARAIFNSASRDQTTLDFQPFNCPARIRDLLMPLVSAIHELGHQRLGTCPPVAKRSKTSGVSSSPWKCGPSRSNWSRVIS